MKQKAKTSVLTKKNQGSTVKKGMRGITQSFLNVGIPVIMETQMDIQYRGISARLVRGGNTPVSGSERLKIKL